MEDKADAYDNASRSESVTGKLLYLLEEAVQGHIDNIDASAFIVLYNLNAANVDSVQEF